MKENSIELSYAAPQALDFEEVVLGALMLEGEAWELIRAFMLPECFYKSSHQEIFRAMISIAKRQDPIDILSVAKELKATGQLDNCGGAYYVTQLTNRVSSSANIEFHARIIYQAYLKRQIIEKATTAIREAYDESSDVIDLLDKTSSTFRSIQNLIMDQSRSRSIEKVIDDTFDAMAHAKKNKGVLGYNTNLKKLDDLLCGLQPGTVYVIAARPGMGKSALIKTIMVNLAKQKIKTLVFSMEVKAEKFMMNIFADILETNNRRVFSGELLDTEYQKIRDTIKELKDYMDIDDKAAITVQYMERRAKRAVAQGVKVLIVDYLQLMTVLKMDVDPTNRERQISFLTGNIKRIATELGVPVIEVSQLSREVEKRADKKPVLSDLRESGAIEQDAEVVMFVYRPEYYGFKVDKKGNNLEGLAHVIVAKNRNGDVDRAILKYIKEYTKFDNFENSMEQIEDTQIEIFTNEPGEGDDPAF